MKMKYLGFQFMALLLQKFLTENLILIKRDKEDIQIYLSKHVKVRNIGINDVEIIDKELGIISIKKDQIYDRFARESGRASRIKNTCLEIWHVIVIMKKKGDMLIIN